MAPPPPHHRQSSTCWNLLYVYNIYIYTVWQSEAVVHDWGINKNSSAASKYMTLSICSFASLSDMRRSPASENDQEGSITSHTWARLRPNTQLDHNLSTILSQKTRWAKHFFVDHNLARGDDIICNPCLFNRRHFTSLKNYTNSNTLHRVTCTHIKYVYIYIYGLNMSECRLVTIHLLHTHVRLRDNYSTCINDRHDSSWF